MPIAKSATAGRATKLRQFAHWVFLAVVLTVSSAQACHVCGLGELQTAQGSSASAATQVSSNANGICLLCVSTQPGTQAVTLLALAPVIAATQTKPALRSRTNSAEPIFALYVRPPPAL